MLLYLQAGLAVFLLPVNRDSLAARNSISRLVSSSVTTMKQNDFSSPADELNLCRQTASCFTQHVRNVVGVNVTTSSLKAPSFDFRQLCGSLSLYFIHFKGSSCTSLHLADVSLLVTLQSEITLKTQLNYR